MDRTVRTGPDQITGARRTPVRTCVGCRERDDQRALLRVVAVRDDRPPRWRVVPDQGRREQGRGAYVHPRAQCLQTAIARRAFARALRLPAGSEADASVVQEWLSKQP